MAVGVYHLDGVNSIPVIQGALKDKHPLVRKRVAICLGWSGSDMVVQIQEGITAPQLRVRLALNDVPFTTSHFPASSRLLRAPPGATGQETICQD